MAPVAVQHAFGLAQQHHQAGRLQEAERLYRQILAQQPTHADAVHYLGVIAHQVGRNDVAAELIRQAIALRPNYADAYNNLGVALIDQGQIDAAIIAFRQAVALRPNYPDALNNLGGALKDKGQSDEAMIALRQAIALRPDYADAYNNLGVAMKDQGQLEEAIAAHRRAVDLRPGYVEAHSNLIYAMHYHAGCDASAIAGELRRWNRQHAQPLRGLIRPHGNDRNPDRRLRIGYVSPDFRDHVVGRFFLPLLDHHDRAGFEIFCYSNVHDPDTLTERMRSQAQGWRSIVGVSDDAAAEAIRQDRIDILVDLTLHTAGNRLLVFARKPAPVQVTYLAYCSTSGLETIDYRLTDPHLDPAMANTAETPAGNPVQAAEEIDAIYSEKSIRLPDVYWCYAPAPGFPEVAPLPALRAGHITFGCLNNFAKVSPEAIATWIEILKELPSSRLLLHARPGEHRRRLLDRVGREGIHPARLAFADYQPGQDYLRQYHAIDIGLDPFPYAGGTTTCDALWMGVPVITLAGRTAVGRSGVTLLNSVGLGDLVGKTPEQYRQLAVQLATDLVRLGDLRSDLRERMRRSPLMDAPRFARNIEAAYRAMWRNWSQAPSAKK